MKRFFRNLKTLAMAAVVGLATLSVSCYDDAELRDSIQKNEEAITDLTARVEALEIKLGNEVNALKALIADEIAKVNDAIEAVEDKIVIASAEQGADGEWVLTLANGETVTVYPEYQENNEGLLTTVKENGVYYWAQIVDGVAVKLTDANGNGYAVHHATVVPEIPEGHDAPQVRVNEAGYNEVSFDGGQTWIQLGGGGDAGLFQSVTTTDNSITFVLNGGQEFTVALPEPFNFEVDGNKVFLNVEQELAVKMVVSGVKDLTIVAKPEGWKAAINGNKLNVVAPAQDAVDAATAEKSGTIKVLGITNENKAIMGKLNVSVDKGVYISLGVAEVWNGEYDENWDYVMVEAEAVIFDNQMVTMVEDWYTGELVEEPQPLMVGIFPKGEYTMEQLANELEQGWYGNYPYGTNNIYEGGINAYALDGFFMDNWSGDTIPFEAGGRYIIFAAPYVSAGMGAEINPDDIVTYEYINTALEVKEVSASAFDVQIDVNISGFDAYRYLLLEAQYSWEDEWNQVAQWGEPFGYEGTYEKFEGSLFEFGTTGSSYSDLTPLPGTLYNLVIAPMVDGEYLQENVKVFTFKTAAAVAGGSIAPVFTEGATDYSSIKVDVDATGAAMTLYQWYNEDSYAAFEGDDELLFESVSAGYVKTDETFSINNGGLSQGASRWLVAYSIDKDGKYGAMTKQKFTTKVFQFSETMTIAIDEFKLSDDGKEAWVKVSVTGNTSDIVQYRYGNVNNTFSWTNTYGGSVEAAAQYIATVPNAYYGPKFVDPTKDLDENGYIHLTNLAVGEDYHFVIIAMDAEGNVTPGVGHDYTPELKGTLIYADEAAWAASAPTITIGEKDIYEMYSMKYADYSYTVTPGEGTAKYWYRYMDSDYENSYSSPWALMQYMVTNTGTSEYYSQMVEGAEPTTATVWEAYVSPTTHIYVTWTDGNGNYFECAKVRVFTDEECATEDEGGEDIGGGDIGIM